MVTEKTTCRLCRAPDLERFLDLGDQPPANAFLKPDDFPLEKKYPLQLGRCTSPECGFVQLLHVVDPETLFAEYVYVSSTSPVFVKHFEEYAEAMDARLSLAGKLTLDIGSNDGVLVKPLKALGAKALGVDPAREIAKRASAEGLETIHGYFTERFAKDLAEKRGPAALITANNVFAHIDDLDDVARGVKALLAPDGLFVIEAPYLKVFLDDKLFDTVYHEHLSYLALRPLQRFFKKFDLRIVDAEMVHTHGGSVRMMVAHDGSPHQESGAVAEMIRIEEDAGLFSSSAYQKFAADVLENKRMLVALLSDIIGQGKKIAGYGAPAKGNTLLNYMEIGPKILAYIVDDSPLKQGLYTPGTHIPVVSAEMLAAQPPQYLFILAWNFAEPIMKKNESFRAKGGAFIIPTPTARIVA